MNTVKELIEKLNELVSEIKGGYTPTEFHKAVSDGTRYFLSQKGFELSIWKFSIPYNHEKEWKNTPSCMEDFLCYNLEKEDYKNRTFSNTKWKVLKVWFHVPGKYGSIDLSASLDEYRSFLDKFHANRQIREWKEAVRKKEDELAELEEKLSDRMTSLSAYLK